MFYPLSLPSLPSASRLSLTLPCNLLTEMMPELTSSRIIPSYVFYETNWNVVPWIDTLATMSEQPVWSRLWRSLHLLPFFIQNPKNASTIHSVHSIHKTKRLKSNAARTPCSQSTILPAQAPRSVPIWPAGPVSQFSDTISSRIPQNARSCTISVLKEVILVSVYLVQGVVNMSSALILSANCNPDTRKVLSPLQSANFRSPANVTVQNISPGSSFISECHAAAESGTISQGSSHANC